MKLEISKLKALSQSILLQNGISAEDADIIVSHLLEEELLGKHSHGFIRIPSILNLSKTFKGKSSLINERKSEFAIRIIAENTVGLVAAFRAAETAISTAKEKGISIVSTIGYQGTTGALGYYGRMIVKEEMIGIISCSSEYAVAPWGGRDAILGTNPIAIALPNGNEPIIVDFSTAAMTYGDLMLAVKEGREVPYGVVLDRDGRPSHDPDDANNGCQLPMAGHKGYALGLALEVLAELFIGAKSGKNAVIGTDGTIIMVLKPDLFVNQNQYYNDVSALIKEIRTSELAVGSPGIRIPGENSIQKIKDAFASGMCELPDVVYNDMLNL